MAKKENERPEKAVKVKGRKKQKKILKAMIIIISAALLAFTAFYVAPQVRQSINSSKSEDNGDAILSFDREIVGAMHLSGGEIVVTTNSVVSVKSNGEERYSENLGYSSPVFKASDRKYIIFERASGKYTVGDKSKVIYSADLDDEIIGGDVASNGSYALITRTAQSTQCMSVYSSDNEQLFVWECSDDYLTDVALSKNGKAIAVSALNVVNGDIYSRIYFFYTNSLGIEGKIEYPNETVYKIKFIDNENVSVVTDISYMKANMKERRSQVVSYEYDELSGYSFGSKSSVAILKKEFGSLNEKKLSVINKKCESVFEASIESEILDFATDSKKVYVLISGKVLIYSVSSGEMVGDVHVDASVSKLLVSGKKIFGLSENEVYMYDIQ